MLLYLVFLSLLPLTVEYSTKPPIRRRCDEPVDHQQYEDLFMSDEGSFSGSANCFFVVKNSHLISNDEPFTVDLNQARRICKQHQATLPITQTEGEYKFLLKSYREKTKMVLLGLKRATNLHYIWDNFHGVWFKPENWTKIDGHLIGTNTFLITKDGRWEEFLPDHTFPTSQAFPLICHQRGYGSNGLSFSKDYLDYYGPEVDAPKKPEERGIRIRSVVMPPLEAATNQNGKEKIQIDLAISILMVIINFIVFN